MADAFANKIKRLELENFTCFGKVEMDFSPGINVFIGENGTGKTHLLKVLYALSLEKEHEPLPLNNGKWNFMLNASYNFIELFKPENNNLFRLVKNTNDIGCNIKLTFGNDQDFNFRITKLSETIGAGSESTFTIPIKDCLYIPPMEMLSWFRGFIPSYEKRESSIDTTYYYLARALSPLPLKGREMEEAMEIARDVANSIKLNVIRKGDQFFITFQNSKNEIEAPLIATGINKLAQLIYLIMNGSLTKDTILFWDEPEAGLNPKYIKPVAQFLLTLAKAGCQIFVATHDYLLPYELSLSVEYPVENQPAPPMKFFTLMKGENGTVVESGDTMYDLPYDAIMEGHLQFHEKREQLQRDSLNQ